MEVITALKKTSDCMGWESSIPSLSYWLIEEERQFTIEADLSRRLPLAKAIGSLENEVFYEYFNGYYPLFDQLDEQTNNWRLFQNEDAFPFTKRRRPQEC